MKLFNRQYIIACILILAGTAEMSAQNENTLTGDSIPYGHFEDERTTRDSSKISKINKAEQKGETSAMEYVMDKRYHNIGESFDRKWYKNLYLEAGAGFEQIAPIKEYGFNPLTMARFGIGWQMSRLSSMRLMGVGGWGYQQNKHDLLGTLGLKADYIFSLSSYLYGYNPSRPLNVSAVIGAGARKTWLAPSSRNGMSYDAHFGLQAKLYTGPHGFMSIEPYVALGTDNMDLSEYRNWRKADIAFGATFNYIYYINNVLSRESRLRIIKSIVDGNAFINDSTLKRWAQPWFIEFSNGINFSTSPGMKFAETAGLATTVSVGKWLSPVMGIRASGIIKSASCGTETTGSTGNPSLKYTATHHSVYGGARLEAMLNPFGGMKNFRWDSKYGMFLVAGGEFGRIQKFGTGLTRYTVSYTGGINLWGRLGQGLMAFVEPRYSYTEYDLKSRNVLSDNGFTVNVGLRMQNQGYKLDKKHDANGDMPEGRWSVGIGGGVNFKLTSKSYKSLPNYNARLFADYMISKTSGVEVAFERVSLANRDYVQYWDCSFEQNKYTKHQRTGMADYRYNYGLLSVDYLINLSRLFHGAYKRKPLFELQMQFGPNVAFGLWNNWTLAKEENLQQNHKAEPVSKAKATTNIGFNGGLKLKCNVSPQLSVFFAPTLYWMGTKDMPNLDLVSLKHIETMNVGLQFNLIRRAHIINSIFDKNGQINNSMSERWANPWFIEFSNGLSFRTANGMSFAETAGMETTISVGKWLSPVLGLRASGVIRSTRCGTETTGSTGIHSQNYTVNQHSVYGGARLEAMINPLGYKDNFSWDDKFGMFLVAGGELGKIQKFGSGLTRHAISYTGGINLWGRLGQGLMAFVEPRYTYSEYDLKSTNVQSDNGLTVNVGLRIQNHGIRTGVRKNAEDDVQEEKLAVGIGGGVSFKLTSKSYKPLLSYNGRLFADYMISKASGVEVAFERVSLANREYAQYWDCNNEQGSRTMRAVMADYRYNYGLLSVDYLINMSRLFCGDKGKRPLFELQMLIGPNVAFGLWNNCTLEAEERLPQNHTAEPVNNMKTKTTLGFNGGLKLKCNVSPQLSVFFAPTLYWMATKDMPNLDLISVKHFETMNVGVQFNLSRGRNAHAVRSIFERQDLTNDSTPNKWAKPWFFEFSNGINFSSTPNLDFAKTSGMATTVSVGKWLSKAVGLRLSGAVRNSKWAEETTYGVDYQSPQHTANLHATYTDIRLEAMLNPLGFSKNFKWDSRFGFYIVGGGGLGRVSRNGSGNSYDTESYTAGINAWARLGNGLTAFVEPRYAYTEYKVPFSTHEESKTHYDNSMTVNVGLRIQNLGQKSDRRHYADDGEETGKLSVGLGGGVNFKTTKRSFDPQLSYNGRLFADYMISEVSGLEMAFEYASVAKRNYSQFWDCNLALSESNNFKTMKNGLSDNRYNYGILSVDYLLNMSRLFYGTPDKRPLFELQMLIGPNVALGISKNWKLAANERLRPNHVAEPADNAKPKTVLGFNGGLKLKCNFSPRLSAFFAPTIYWMGTKDIPGLDMAKLKYIETMNVGVQYNL